MVILHLCGARAGQRGARGGPEEHRGHIFQTLMPNIDIAIPPQGNKLTWNAASAAPPQRYGITLNATSAVLPKGRS